jgi:hypothetical protein
MDTTVRDVILALELDSVFWQELPKIRIEFNGSELFAGPAEKELKFNWTLPAQDLNRLSVFFLNKKDSDSVDGKDKAVIIKRIGIEGFYYDSFMHRTRYRPEYSEGYYNYAKENNIKVEPVIHSNYLGFNGEWFLEFAWPTFTWIYNLETNNQGWIYEKNI